MIGLNVTLDVTLDDSPEDQVYNVVSEPYIAYNAQKRPSTYIMVCDLKTNKISEVNANRINKRIYLNN